MPLVSKTFDQLLDFTRTSAATFVGSDGLIQNTAASRNLLLQTQQFDNAVWTKGNATVTANTTVAPDGTSTADTLVENTATAVHFVRMPTFTPVSGTTYTASIYVKAAGRTNVQLVNYNNAVDIVSIFNLSTGTVVSGSGAIVAAGDGWFRISQPFTAASSASTIFAFGVQLHNGTTNNYTGDGTSGIYVWGAQLEAASAATTYTRNNGGVFPPRFEYDPVTLAPKGLLIEEQRTNLLTYSEQFDNAAWIKTTSTVTANATTSPDGTVDADRLIPNAASSDGRVTLGVTGSAGATYTLTVYGKADAFSNIRLYSDDGTTNVASVSYSLSTGLVTTALNVGGTWTAGSTTATAVGNGWYRLSLTWTATGAAPTRVSIWCRDTGNGTSGIFIYGAQLEAGAFATSYIPTVASQVTRTADNCAIVAPNFAPWYNQAEGSFVAEFSCVSGAAGVVVQAGINHNFNDRAVIFNTPANFTVSNAAAVNQAALGNSNLTNTSLAKIAGAYKLDDFAASINGATALTDTSGTVPAPIALSIGSRNPASPAAFLNGHIRSIRYYPTRLSNAQLQALTA